MAFSFEGEAVNWVHSWLHLDLFVAVGLNESLTVEGDHLSLVVEGLDAAVVKLLQGSGYHYGNSWHGWKLGLVQSSESRSEETAIDLCSGLVTNVEEAVVRQEEIVKYLVAILLVNIATLVDSSLVLDSHSEEFRPILVIDCLVLV